MYVNFDWSLTLLVLIIITGAECKEIALFLSGQNLEFWWKSREAWINIFISECLENSSDCN